MSSSSNVYKILSARELGGRRPGTAANQSRSLYQNLCPSSKVQQLDVPEVHICRFSPCGQYLVCFAGGFTQLVVYRFTGPRVSWQGELEEAELLSTVGSFSSFFRLLYRVNLAPPGEVLARDVVLFPGGRSLLLLASHSPFTPPQQQQPGPGQRPPADADPLQALPAARSIQLHVVRLCDGVRLGGSVLEGELVDLGGRPGSLGISVHEDLVAVLALRSQVVHLLQLLRGGEELVAVRCLGPHVAEDDELVLRTAEEAEERWRRARQAEREAAGRGERGLPPVAEALATRGLASQQLAASAAAAAAAAAHPVAVLHPPPPPHRSASPHSHAAGASGAGASAHAGGSGGGMTAADLASASAHQAMVRQQMRQRQYDELAAQAGPSQPPQHRRAPTAVLGRARDLPPQAPGGRFLPQEAGAALLLGQALPPAGSADAAHPSGPATAGGGLLEGGAMPAGPGAPPQHPAAAAATAMRGRGGGGQQPDGDAGGGGAAGSGDGGGGGGGCVSGIKQRLLAHLYRRCLRAHPHNPRRQQREAMALFRNMRTYESLIMRKVFILDRNRLLIDMRTPAGADLGAPVAGGGAAAMTGSGQGLCPSQFFLMFDMQTTKVVSFKASPGDNVIEPYAREALAAAAQPWAEMLPVWDRYAFDNALSDTRRRLWQARGASSSGAGAGAPAGSHAAAAAAASAAAAAAAPADPTSAPSLDLPAAATGDVRASAARKLMQLMPPVSGSCNLSSSPYLDASLFNYDDRMITPFIGARPCLEQPISFRPRNRPECVGFRLEPGPYQPVVSRGRRLARSVTYLFHPDAPFVMAVFSVFQQNSININFRA